MTKGRAAVAVTALLGAALAVGGLGCGAAGGDDGSGRAASTDQGLTTSDMTSVSRAASTPSAGATIGTGDPGGNSIDFRALPSSWSGDGYFSGLVLTDSTSCSTDGHFCFSGYLADGTRVTGAYAFFRGNFDVVFDGTTSDLFFRFGPVGSSDPGPTTTDLTLYLDGAVVGHLHRVASFCMSDGDCTGQDAVSADGCRADAPATCDAPTHACVITCASSSASGDAGAGADCAPSP